MRLDKISKRDLIHMLRDSEITPKMRSRIIEELDENR